MEFKQFYKTINFDIDNEIRTVYQATQGDTKSRGLVVDLIVGGVKTPITTETMNFFALKPDGTRVMTAAVKDGDKFRIDFTNQTFAVPGILLCALVLYGTNGEKIADKKFKMTVDTSLEDGAIISEDERGILDRAFDLASDIVPRLEALDVPLLENLEQEVITARGTEATLGARLNSTDAQLSETEQRIGNFIRRGKNKFDGIYRNVSLLSDGTFRIDASSMSAVIPIIGGKTYYFRKDTGNRSRLAFHKTLPTFTDTSTPVDYYEGDLVKWRGYLAPVDAKYLIYTVSNVLISPPQLQITEGADYPFFVGYDVNIDIEDGTLDIDVLANGEKYKALFKTFKGELYGNNPILKIDYTTKTLTVPSGTRVFYNGMRTVINNTTLDFSDNPGTVPMALVYVPETSNLKLHYISTSSSLRDNEILLGIISYVKPEMVGINIDNCEINGEMFVQPQIKAEINNRFALDERSYEKFFLLDDITGLYEKPSDIVSVASGQPFDLVASTSEDIYAIYDDLVTRFPDYVSRTLLGNEATGLPIYQYKFTSPDIDNNSEHPYRKLKILLTSAIHGYEQGSAWCLAQFFKDLCDNYSAKEQLEFMRWNVDFVVVPVANPYGYDNNQRTNSNTVDLNRNFPANWSLRTNDGDVNGYYGGESAGSEIETQLLMSVIDAHTDAEWFIDYHNIAGGYPLFYLYDSEASTIALNTFKTLTRKWKNDYSQAPQDETMFGYVKTGVNACYAKYAIMEHGMKSFVFETPWRMPFGSAKYDKLTIETGIEAFGNTLVTIFKSMK